MGSPLADYQGFTQFRVVEQRFLFEAKVQRSDWDGGERLSQCQDGQRTADQGLENATIVRSTQFFEFVPGIAQAATIGQTLRQLPADLQSIRSDDVADAAADATLCPAVNGMIEIAGPERIPLDERAWRYLRAIKDARQVVADAHARYFGAELNDQSLTPTARRASRIGSAARWRSDNPLPPKAGVLGGRIGANPQTQVSVRETYNE